MPENHTRRDFLSFLGVSASSFAATLSGVRAQSGSVPGVLDVAVVGAGAAGLTAGFLLDRAEASFRIFEASAIHGGRARKDTSFADFPPRSGW